LATKQGYGEISVMEDFDHHEDHAREQGCLVAGSELMLRGWETETRLSVPSAGYESTPPTRPANRRADHGGLARRAAGQGRAEPPRGRAYLVGLTSRS
jgi:hypothetical protein